MLTRQKGADAGVIKWVGSEIKLSESVLLLTSLWVPNEHSPERWQSPKIQIKWVGGSELDLSESLTSAEQPWHLPPPCPAAAKLFYSTVQPSFHQTRPDPAAVHRSILSRWMGAVRVSQFTRDIADQIYPDTASGKDQFSFNPFTHSSQKT